MSVKISGVLKENNSTNALSGLYVEAYNDAHTVWLGGAKSDKNGRFSFYLREDVALEEADAYFPIRLIIYRNNIPYHTIRYSEWQEEFDIVLSSLNERAPDVTHEVSDADSDYFTVFGTVSDSAGTKVDVATIMVYAAGFRDNNRLITKAQTDAKGAYSVKIARASLNVEETSGERGLFVKAVKDADTITSDVFFNIPLKLEVNLQSEAVLSPAITEYERIETALQTILEGSLISGISLEEDNREDRYLAGVIGEDEDKILVMIKAHSYAEEHELQPAVVYALLRSQAGTDKDAAFNQKESVLRSIIAAAEDSYVIAAIESADLDEDIQIILEWQVDSVKEIPVPIEETTLGEILEQAFPNDADVNYGNRILNAARDFTGSTIQEFWTEYETQYGGVQKSKAQKGLQLLAVTGLQPQLTNYLLDPGNLDAEISALVTWSEADWVEAIEAAGDGEVIVPKSMGEVTNSDYAAKLKTTIESLYPTASIAAKITTDETLLGDEAMQDTVVSFLTNNPHYNLATDSIYDIAEGDFDFTGIDPEEDLPFLKEELAPFQRLARVTGNTPGAIEVLKKDNLTSAHAIVNAKSREQFVADYGSQLGGAANATAYYNNAARISVAANEAAIQLRQYNNGATPYVFQGNLTIDPVAAPELATLFGSLEQCGCEYCMSLYSPSAYYTDILNFIKQSSNSAASAFTELTRRRPDLLYIDLTCKNANTPVPYVDLVNELLELEILRKNSISGLPLSYQTEGTATEIAAYPEHVEEVVTQVATPTQSKESHYENSVVYRQVYDNVLNTEKYTDTLPFNLAWEEARVYLKHLGKTRYELMQLFKPLNPSILTNNTSAKVTDRNLLNEYLGIPKEAADHITLTSTSAADVAPYYGLDPLVTNSILSPGNTAVELSDSWINLLTGDTTGGGIDVLLSRLNITYKELLQLLTTDSLNRKVGPDRQVNIVSKSMAEEDQASCDLRELKLDFDLGAFVSTPEVFFSALHRFVRFWRASKLSIYELDAVLVSLGSSTLNATFLDDAEYKLAVQAIMFSRQFKVSIDEITTWWADISRIQYVDYNTEYQDTLPSFYEKLFMSKLVKNPPDDTFDTSNLYLIKYEDHIPAILAVAGIKEDELKLLVGPSMLDISLSNAVSLSGLTQIFREAVAARALNVSVEDLVRVYNLMGVDLTPAIPRTLAQRQQLLTDLREFIDTVNTSGFSLAEWEYLVNDDDTYAQLMPTQDDMLQFYETLQTELYKIGSVLTDDMSNEQKENIASQLKNIVTQKYSTEHGLNADIVQYLVAELITYPNAASTQFAPLEHAVASAAFYTDNTEDPLDPLSAFTFDYRYPDVGQPDGYATTAVSFDMNDLFEVYLKLSKISLLANRLKLKKETFGLLQENAADLDLIDVLILSGNTTGQFTRYIDWIKVRDRFNVLKEDMKTLVDMVVDGVSQKEDWIDIVTLITKWDRSSLEELVGDHSDAGDLETSYPADFKNGKIILRIAAILHACSVIGITPMEFKRDDGGTERSILWSNLKMADSEKIIKTARAKYNEATWAKIAKPLRDELREKQRKALVAYLLVHPNPTLNTANQRWRNENELYAYFLIDVEMSPCMKTSRTKQAINSVQLFMDRVLMNLEYENMLSATLISVTKDTVEEWKTWRKWYRIWEANRKIFLYPENWIEPELRDGKSPEFVEFETHLMQDDVTPRLVEEAYIDYLEKLDDFSRLEPVTNYHEWDPQNGIDIIHAFSRTHVQPHVYYYRRFESKEWSPWEKIDIDIKGDHFVAYVKNKRLYIFWLTFLEKQLDEASGKLISNTTPQIGTKEINPFYGPGSIPIFQSSRETARKWLDDKWVGTILGDYRDSSSQITAEEINDLADLKKYWEIYLNWSEYKDNKWQKSKLSKEKMELMPSKVTISTLAKFGGAFSIGIPNSNRINWSKNLDFLTKNFEIKLHELFRDRIYLSPREWQNKPILSLQLTDGLDEYCVGLHAFQFTEDMSNVKVLRDDELEFCIKAPEYTLIHTNKFLESPVNNDRLELSAMRKVWDTHYGYTFKRMEPSQRASNDANETLLEHTPLGLYKVAAKSNMEADGFVSLSPLSNHFFFEDERNTFFVKKIFEQYQFEPLRDPENTGIESVLGFVNDVYWSRTVSPIDAAIQLPGSVGVTQIKGEAYYKFETFYHPHTDNFIRKINMEGIKGLLDLSMQEKDDAMNFDTTYMPNAFLVYPFHPTDVVDFEYGGSYSLYNWELFFHMPMTIAQRLSDNQQFEEAQKWFHYIFDPTSNSDDTGQVTSEKERFWRFRPFYEFTLQQRGSLTNAQFAQNFSYADQIDAWEKNPFKPHVVARMRIMAYMKNVVMKYIDNLIAWGDQLFRRDTIESINEATQLYILAANILGDRPQEVPARAKSEMYCFDELDDIGLDKFSNATVQIESFLGPNIAAGSGSSVNISPASSNSVYVSFSQPVASLGKMSYFCLPTNDKLLGYWDTVADRLFKIRNCRNIDGVVRELPLYEPPIDPALLVKAAAVGLSTASMVDAAAGTGMPHYRFQYVLQKANELCADVRGLGSAMLSALEKKDAEALALLRSGHELSVLEKVKAVKEAQVKEAEEALNGMQKTKEVTQIRQRYYSTRQFMNSGEQQHLQSLQAGMVLQTAQGALQTTVSALGVIPQFHGQLLTAVGGSFGGQQLCAALNAVSQGIGISAAINSSKGNMAQVKGGYERRMDDWKFQIETAQKELEQIDKQLIAAEIRLAIANKELENHELQMENSKEADEYMRSKFTNEQLYNWMLGQLATVYFQSYQLAYDLAKKAEQCYDYELPHAKDKKPATGFIQFGYWDSLKKGLLAGEKLQFDLRKMDASYMEQNKRTLELTKHISLALMNPEAVLELRSKGTCVFDTNEWMFDLDFPNHYYRRIKSVSISIPAITGPYTTVNATLSIGTSTVYDENHAAVSSLKPAMSSIATSNGQNDAGVFELNFRDERHLPFEGAGVEAGWTLNMMDQEEFRQFDYNTIADVIVHIKYTAYDGGDSKKTESLTRLNEYLANTVPGKELPRYFSLKHEFSNDWYAYAKTANNAEHPSNFLELNLNKENYPFFCKDKEIESKSFFVLLKPKQPFDSGSSTVIVELYDEEDDFIEDANINLTTGSTLVNSGTMMLSSSIDLSNVIMKWKVKVNGSVVNIDELFDDIYLVTYYTLSTS
ncbi:MAG TPA: neuraminidase-like domain-containing protein [Flavipsychrobacter sp.]|nr:neuraminidase-like domain-containing protein [Flavipsychrobacter sp.]